MATSAEEVDGDQDEGEVTKERVPDSWVFAINERPSKYWSRESGLDSRKSHDRADSEAPIEGFGRSGSLTDAGV